MTLWTFLAGLVLPLAAQPATAFVETACTVPDVPPAVAPRLRCGTVAVPRSYEHPDAGQFDLAVVVAAPADGPAAPDPVVYISGGPGSPLTVFAAAQASRPYAPHRALVLVDQRGTGRSDPRICPETTPALLQAAVAVATDPAEPAQATRRAAYAACRSEAAGRGLDLRDFGTRTTAEDFDQVRRALGFERWNVYGESYGTAVAMTLATLHPTTVRSLVLDSVYVPDRAWWSVVAGRAEAAFFATCAATPSCAGPYPALARTYADTLVRLREAPLSVPAPAALPTPDGSPKGQMDLTATLFAVVVANLVYYPPFYPGLPRLIASVHDRRTDRVAPTLADLLAVPQGVDQALAAAVQCRDRPALRTALPADAPVLDRIQLYGVCQGWPEPDAGPAVPAGTDVPTLVLAGAFDPVSGPELARAVAAEIGHSARLAVFPRVGHNVRHFSPCGASIASAFVESPDQPVDLACAERRPPVPFLPPDGSAR